MRAHTSDTKLIEKLLKEREDRFRSLIEKSSDIIILSDGKGHYSYVSPSVKHMLGYTPEEFVKLTRPDFVHPEDIAMVKHDMVAILDHAGNSISGKFRIRHKNGSWRWVESHATNLLHDKNIQAVISNLRDITDREILARQKDDFMAIASHELKTPVASIKAYTQILHHRFLTAGHLESAKLVAKMDSQLDKLTHLICDLLDVTKIEEGKLRFHQDYFTLNTLIKEIGEEMQRTTNHHILIDIDKTQRKKIFGDRERIGQVLINLISNAIKYSPKANKIKVGTALHEKTVIVFVQDFGIGLAKKDQAKIFNRFYRVTEVKDQTYPGLGLGLYICAEIIKRHNGKIWVEGNKNHGSTFCFSIPL